MKKGVQLLRAIHSNKLLIAADHLIGAKVLTEFLARKGELL